MSFTPRPQNLIAQSQSGTGKTAAFVLAMLSHVDPSLKWPQVSLKTEIHSNVPFHSDLRQDAAGKTFVFSDTGQFWSDFMFMRLKRLHI